VTDRRYVVLVGFMAAGKSTVGRRLAALLGVDFVDTDALVAAAHGPIPEIFARAGEARFRAYEHEAVLATLARPPCVVSVGGGALTHDETHATLALAATRVYLCVSARTLLARLRRSKTPRPIAGEMPTLEHVERLLAAREARYREAEIVVDAQRRSVSAVAYAVRDALTGARGIATAPSESPERA